MLQHPKYVGKNLYDIISATRGCDIKTQNQEQWDAVKLVEEEITGRLRVIIYGNMTPSAYQIQVIWTTRDLQTEYWQPLVAALYWISNDRSYHHWLIHLYDAVLACQDDPIWGGHGAALVRLLRYANDGQRHHHWCPRCYAMLEKHLPYQCIVG